MTGGTLLVGSYTTTTDGSGLVSSVPFSLWYRHRSFLGYIVVPQSRKDPTSDQNRTVQEFWLSVSIQMTFRLLLILNLRESTYSGHSLLSSTFSYSTLLRTVKPVGRFFDHTDLVLPSSTLPSSTWISPLPLSVLPRTSDTIPETGNRLRLVGRLNTDTTLVRLLPFSPTSRRLHC